MWEVRRALCTIAPDGGIDTVLSNVETIQTFETGDEAIDWIDAQDWVETDRGTEVWKDGEGRCVWIENEDDA